MDKYEAKAERIKKRVLTALTTQGYPANRLLKIFMDAIDLEDESGLTSDLNQLLDIFDERTKDLFTINEINIQIVIDVVRKGYALRRAKLEACKAHVYNACNFLLGPLNTHCTIEDLCYKIPLVPYVASKPEYMDITNHCIHSLTSKKASIEDIVAYLLARYVIHHEEAPPPIESALSSYTGKTIKNKAVLARYNKHFNIGTWKTYTPGGKLDITKATKRLAYKTDESEHPILRISMSPRACEFSYFKNTGKKSLSKKEKATLEQLLEELRTLEPTGGRAYEGISFINWITQTPIHPALQRQERAIRKHIEVQYLEIDPTPPEAVPAPRLLNEAVDKLRRDHDPRFIKYAFKPLYTAITDYVIELIPTAKEYRDKGLETTPFITYGEIVELTRSETSIFEKLLTPSKEELAQTFLERRKTNLDNITLEDYIIYEQLKRAGLSFYNGLSGEPYCLPMLKEIEEGSIYSLTNEKAQEIKSVFHSNLISSFTELYKIRAFFKPFATLFKEPRIEQLAGDITSLEAMVEKTNDKIFILYELLTGEGAVLKQKKEALAAAYHCFDYSFFEVNKDMQKAFSDLIHSGYNERRLRKSLFHLLSSSKTNIYELEYYLNDSYAQEILKYGKYNR